MKQPRPCKTSADFDRHMLLSVGIEALAKRVGPDPYTFIIAAIEECAKNLYLSLSANTEELREYLTALAEFASSDTRDGAVYEAQQERLFAARSRLLVILEPNCARYRSGYSPPSVPE